MHLIVGQSLGHLLFEHDQHGLGSLGWRVDNRFSLADRALDGGAQRGDPVFVSGDVVDVGFEVAGALSARWQLPRAKKKFGGLITDGRIAPGGPRVAILLPQTFMNESGRSVGPAAGSKRIPPERIVAPDFGGPGYAIALHGDMVVHRGGPLTAEEVSKLENLKAQQDELLKRLDEVEKNAAANNEQMKKGLILPITKSLKSWNCGSRTDLTIWPGSTLY